MKVYYIYRALQKQLLKKYGVEEAHLQLLDLSSQGRMSPHMLEE